MTPYPPGFRRVLRRNIPQICDKKLNHYEELTAFRHQLVQEKHLVPYKKRGQAQPPEVEVQHREKKSPHKEHKPQSSNFESDITEITGQAQKIFKDHADAYNHSRRLWVARRRLALQQGNFFQVPLTPRHFIRLIRAILKYWGVRLWTFFPLTWNQVEYYLRNISVARALVIIIMVALLILSWLNLTPQKQPDTQPDAAREQQLR